MTTNTFYQVNSEGYDKKLGYWRPAGSGPGGKTLEEAYKRVREDIARLNTTNPKLLKTVRFKIEKIVTETSTVEVINGEEIAFFMLKTA